MSKKSWFEGFVGKLKNVFQSTEQQTNEPTENEFFQKKEYTAEQQEFIQEMFERFSTAMKNVNGLSTQQQLGLYGLYKQATVGDCNIKQPAFYEQQAKYKFKAWNKMKGLGRNEAKQIYIQVANEFNPSEVNDLIQKGGKTFTSAVSRPKIQEQEAEYDHPYFSKILNDEEIQIQKQLLLKLNSVPNILPLHFAIDNQKIEYVKLFLKYLNKQQINLCDGEGMSSLQYAELIGNQQILQLIRQSIEKSE